MSNDLRLQTRSADGRLAVLEDRPKQPNRFDDGSGAATLHKQKAYLEAYAATGSITKAAEQVGISRHAYYYWLSDPEFEAAATEIEQWWTQKLRDTVLERTGEATKNEMVRFNYTAFEMKRRDERYKDNFKVEVNLGVQVAAGDWGQVADSYFSRSRAHNSLSESAESGDS